MSSIKTKIKGKYIPFPTKILNILKDENAKSSTYQLVILLYEYYKIRFECNGEDSVKIECGRKNNSLNKWKLSHNTFDSAFKELVKFNIIQDEHRKEKTIHIVKFNFEYINSYIPKIKNTDEDSEIVKSGFPTIQDDSFDVVKNKIKLTEKDKLNLKMQLGIEFYPIQSGLRNENDIIKNNVDFICKLDDECGFCSVFNMKPDEEYIQKIYSNMNTEYYWLYIIYTNEVNQFEIIKIQPKIRNREKDNIYGI